MIIRKLIGCLLTLALVSPAFAQNGETEAVPVPVEAVEAEPATNEPVEAAEAVEPAEAPAPAEGERSLRGQIVGVQGLVQIREEEGEWMTAKAGMPVTEGSEFRTGPRSAVQFAIEGGHVITLDRLGTMKVLTAVEQADGSIKTDMGMKYGRTSYQIEAGGKEHESTVRSPGATLAVRGSHMVVQSSSLGTWHQMLQHYGFSQIDGKINEVGEGSDLTDEDLNTADHKWVETFLDPENEFGNDLVDRQLALLLQGLGGLQIDRMNPQVLVALRNAIEMRQPFLNDDSEIPSFGQFFTELSYIDIEVFDDQVIDGDVVNVFFNGNNIAEGLVLDRPGAFFNLDLNLGVNTLRLDAVGNGSLNPNTGRVTVIQTDTSFDFTMDANFNESRVLEIIRQEYEGGGQIDQ